MVCVNFRLKTVWKKDEIVEFFKDLGYVYRGTNKKSIKVEDKHVPTEEFIKRKQKGRNHIFVEIGHKYSGTSHPPQMKIYAHYDIIKIVKGREKHFSDRNEERNLKEINRIEKQLKFKKLGHLELKDKNCAHGTFELVHSDKLNKIIEKDYIKYEKGKFRMKSKFHQFFSPKMNKLLCINLLDSF